MSEPAVWIDDAGYQNLRVVADRLLETTRVEYVDEGVLLVMNPPGIEHRRIVRAIVDDDRQAAPSPISRPSSATAGELVRKMTTQSAGAVMVSRTSAPSRVLTVPITWPSASESPAATSGCHH